MKRKIYVKIIALLCATVICALLLCSCETKLTLKDGKIYCDKTGAKYSFVNSVYLPKAIATEPYAVFTFNKIKTNYYQIEGLEPEEWLISEGGDVIYAGTDTLPNLAGFRATEMFVCYNYDTPFSIIDEKDAEKVLAIVDRFCNGEESSPSIYDYSTYRVMFVSDEYPAFYYQLKLRVCEDAMYLVDIGSGISVEVSELFKGYPDLAYYEEEYDG